MGNTYFYNEMKYDENSVGWKDIFSETLKKHTKAEFEYALTAGTSMNMATEADMLKKWRRPWIWARIAAAGGIIFLIMLLACGLPSLLSGHYLFVSGIMLAVVLTLLLPFIIAVFVWELNIPKNISLLSYIAMFLAGGALSFGCVAALFTIFPGMGTVMLREEIGKFIPALIILILFSRRKKVYGITGLVIGGAVGWGFETFENLQYVLSSGEFSGGSYSISILDALKMPLVDRGIGLGLHIYWCSMYTAAFALAMKNGKVDKNCFLDKDFLIFLGTAMGTHWLWDNTPSILIPVYLVIVFWMWLRIIRKSLHQCIMIGNYRGGRAGYDNRAGGNAAGVRKIGVRSGGDAASVRGSGDRSGRGTVGAGHLLTAQGELTLVCLAGKLKGAVWQAKGRQKLRMGREEGNQVRLPNDSKGVSRRHCEIYNTSSGWMVRDMNSTYGTVVMRIGKLQKGQAVRLQDGDIIYLADQKQKFRVNIR